MGCCEGNDKLANCGSDTSMKQSITKTTLLLLRKQKLPKRRLSKNPSLARLLLLQQQRQRCRNGGIVNYLERAKPQKLPDDEASERKLSKRQRRISPLLYTL